MRCLIESPIAPRATLPQRKCSIAPRACPGSLQQSRVKDIGAPAAITSAMIDALGSVGVRGVDMPFTPMKVWEALRAASKPLPTEKVSA